jgi:hypothetical protein
MIPNVITVAAARTTAQVMIFLFMTDSPFPSKLQETVCG